MYASVRARLYHSTPITCDPKMCVPSNRAAFVRSIGDALHEYFAAASVNCPNKHTGYAITAASRPFIPPTDCRRKKSTPPIGSHKIRNTNFGNFSVKDWFAMRGVVSRQLRISTPPKTLVPRGQQLGRRDGQDDRCAVHRRRLHGHALVQP